MRYQVMGHVRPQGLSEYFLATMFRCHNASGINTFFVYIQCLRYLHPFLYIGYMVKLVSPLACLNRKTSFLLRSRAPNRCAMISWVKWRRPRNDPRRITHSIATQQVGSMFVPSKI